MKFSKMINLIVLLLLALESGRGQGKECTNVPSSISTSSARYELAVTKNETWKKEVSQRYDLMHSDDSQWSGLFPRKALKQVAKEKFDWDMLYRQMKYQNGSDLPGGFLKEVSLHDVRLDPDSLHGRAQRTNLEFLLMLDVDSLVWSFRKTAGLPTPGQPYGGWEAPNIELRGHFVGHFLSSTAQMWASTGNEEIYQKMNAVLSALNECQQKMGSGYLSAFPSEEFDRYERVVYVWAPYYTIHKILAGLLDQYTLAGNEQALKMMKWMVDYFGDRIRNVIQKYSIERHYLALNEETGGMNDVLYRLYSITGDEKHLVLAHLFDKPCFLGYLALKADSLSGFHVNTHIPVVIGAQMRYEFTGDPLYREMVTYFMDVVNSSHAYATGGTSVHEHWSDPKRLAGTLMSENEESCTTYNMLKVARNLFRWTKETVYADYYERALTNGVLSIQRGTEPGIMIYMLPLAAGSSKARSYHGWGTQNNSFWCCYGTATESFAKLGDSIYFEEEGSIPTLYVIQYISSSLNWKSGQLALNQAVVPANSWDPYLRVTIAITPKEGAAQSTLKLRVPVWAYSDSDSASGAINTQALSLPAPGGVLSITRKWSSGDTVTVQLPLGLRTEAIKDDRPEYATLEAILYGPYLLAGLSQGETDLKSVSPKSLSDWISPVPATYNSLLISLTQDHPNGTLVLTNTNSTMTMEKLPAVGTDAAVHGTFRLVTKDPISDASSRGDILGKSVMLEPFDLPGAAVVQQGTYQNLIVSSIESDAEVDRSALFRVVAGLDGGKDTVSLESVSDAGCYVAAEGGEAGHDLDLVCKPKGKDADFQRAASFSLGEGFKQYHPMSFATRGQERNFLLEPLLSLRDETYTIYFDIKA